MYAKVNSLITILGVAILVKLPDNLDKKDLKKLIERMREEHLHELDTPGEYVSEPWVSAEVLLLAYKSQERLNILTAVLILLTTVLAIITLSSLKFV